MSELQYLDYDGLLRYHELLNNKKADKSQISDVIRYSELSLTSDQKVQARTNIGAGTSSFSGSYNDLTNKPTIPSAAANGTFSVKTKVGSNSAVTAADFTANQSGTDDVTFIQGSNVTLTTDTANRTITVAATDTNTTYTFAGGTNKITVTPSEGSAQDVTVTPSIANNVTANGNFAANAIIVGNAANQVAKNSGVTISTTAPGSSSADTTVPTSKAVWSAVTGTYVANLHPAASANYITEPEFKSVKINGSSTNSASSENCVLQYDTINKCVKFIFN